MKAETITELEQQLAIITLELGRTRSELRALQQRQGRTARSTKLLYISSLTAIGLLVGVAFSSRKLGAEWRAAISNSYTTAGTSPYPGRGWSHHRRNF